jgi:LysR family transcriptional regulator, transcriptional activator of nhaA
VNLNYQHLRYFWMTAREGTVTEASKRLLLAPSTVSAQIKTLEDWLGFRLFERRGRRLVLTARGQVVKEYADDIFALGEEMVDASRSETGARHAYRFRVGVGTHLPRLVAWELLSPSLKLEDFPVHLVVREDRADRLVADLAVHHLDLVLSDRPVALSLDVGAESVLLGESSLTLMAAPALAANVLKQFPASLHEAPFLLPEVGSAMRDLLEHWFHRQGVRPRIVAEFGDSALMKDFGQAGAGVFAVPTAIREAVESTYRCVALGELEDCWERLYAVVLPSRKLNPAVASVLSAADSNRYHRREA